MEVDPIIRDLQFVMESGQELEILNFHKSFPVICKAKVESIDRDVVVLIVHPPGSVILESQNETILLSRGLPEAVNANVTSFDLLSGILRLSDFSYVGSHFGERMIARVQPDETIIVKMEGDDWSSDGQLVDVSLSGVGIYVKGDIPERGQTVQLTLPLPEGRVTLPGKILNISDAPEGFFRLSIGFTRNAQEISVVMRYIKDRRTEILSEIEKMYEQAYRARLAQDSQSNG